MGLGLMFRVIDLGLTLGFDPYGQECPKTRSFWLVYTFVCVHTNILFMPSS